MTPKTKIPILAAALLAMCEVGLAQEGSKTLGESPQKKAVATAESIAEELARWKLRQATEVTGEGELEKIESIVERARKSLESDPKRAAMIPVLTEAQAEWIVLLDRIGDEELRPKLAAARAAARAENPDALTRAMAAVLGDPRVASIAEREESRERIATYGKGLLIDERISRAVLLGDGRTISDLGERAAPTLQRLALELTGTQSTGGVALDPLRVLFDASLADGFETAFQLMESDDVFVRRHAARSIVAARPFHRDEAYVARPREGDRLRDEAWDDLLPVLAAEPNVTRKDVRSVLEHFLYRGWVPRDLQEFFLESMDDVPETLRPYPEVIELLQRALKSESPRVRELGAAGLTRVGEFQSVFALANDSTPSIRRIVAGALQGGMSCQFDEARSEWTSRGAMPEFTRAYRSALEAVWLDDEFEEFAIPALEGAGNTLDWKQHRSGAEHQDEVSIDLEHASALVPGAKTPARFSALLSYSGWLRNDVAAFDELFVEQLTRMSDGPFWTNLFYGYPSTLSSLFRRIDTAWVTKVLTAASASRGQLNFHNTSQVNQFDDDSLARLLVVPNLSIQSQRLIIAELRSRNFVLKAPNTVVDAVKNSILMSTSPETKFEEWSALQDIGGDTQQLLLELAQSPNVDAWMVFGYNAEITSLEKSLEAIGLVRASELSPPWRSQLERHVFEYLVESDHPRRRELVLEATNAVPFFWHSVAKDVVARRRPEDLDLLRTYFERGEREHFHHVVQATASYLSEEAAELLLRVAAGPLPQGLRSAVMSGLDTIREYQEAAARWRKNTTLADRRLAAVDALIEILEDDTESIEARAEALRGLGLLGASEELPRLIAALGSEVEALRGAAREAIDRLNAAPVPAAAGETSDD